MTRPNAGDLHGCVAFSPDSRLMAVAYSRSDVLLLEPETGRELALLEGQASHIVSWIGFSHDGTKIAITTESHLIQIWNLAQLRRQLEALKLDWPLPPYDVPSTTIATGPVRVRFRY